MPSNFVAFPQSGKGGSNLYNILSNAGATVPVSAALPKPGSNQGKFNFVSGVAGGLGPFSPKLGPTNQKAPTSTVSQVINGTLYSTTAVLIAPDNYLRSPYARTARGITGRRK